MKEREGKTLSSTFNKPSLRNHRKSCKTRQGIFFPRGPTN